MQAVDINCRYLVKKLERKLYASLLNNGSQGEEMNKMMNWWKETLKKEKSNPLTRTVEVYDGSSIAEPIHATFETNSLLF